MNPGPGMYETYEFSSKRIPLITCHSNTPAKAKTEKNKDIIHLKLGVTEPIGKAKKNRFTECTPHPPFLSSDKRCPPRMVGTTENERLEELEHLRKERVKLILEDRTNKNPKQNKVPFNNSRAKNILNPTG